MQVLARFTPRPKLIAQVLTLVFGSGLLCAVPGIHAGCSDPEIPTTVPFFPQRPGDPIAGYDALTSKGWVGCGIPATYYDLARAILPRSAMPEFETLSDRPVGQEDLPYFVNRFETANGLDVIAPNCLLCHAGRLNGKLVVGLGNADGRHQIFSPIAAKVARWIKWGSLLYFWSPARVAEMWKVGKRTAAVAPYITVPVAGSNPTHNLAWALIMHHDPQTLTWSDEPRIALPPLEAPPADVPPWWRMSKKHAMFAAAGGQGDHTGFTAVNSTLCADTVEEYEALYDYFDDIRAYVVSITPPKYPYDIDAALAAGGHAVFEQRCQGCHGTYGDDPAAESYPNRLVPLRCVGTDPALAEYNVVESAPATAWLNASVFTRHGTYAPYLAYVAPPLDGIWATAPFLHNGSLPTLAALLHSAARPRYWTRSYDSRDYDPEAVGWRHTVLDHGHAGEPDEHARRKIVDTTLRGFSNAGHTYADGLTPAARTALLEYLKTL